MTTESDHVRFAQAANCAADHMDDRARRLAQQLQAAPVVVHGRTCRFNGRVDRPVVAHTFTHIVPQGEATSDDVRVDVWWRNVLKWGRSQGRLAGGIHHPTGRVKDHKNRQRVRVEHAQHTFAHTVDLQRTYTHKSAPFRKGGHMWAKCDRVGKRRLRGAVGLADKLAQKGEITAALEFLLGSR